MRKKVGCFSIRSWLAVAIVLSGLLVLRNSAAAQASKSANLSGLASVSGMVESAKPFQAAKVYVRNAEKRMLYMVYTNGGRYQAMHLFPGNYELSVQAKGLESDVQKLVLKAGQNATANVSLREASAAEQRRDVEILPFDEIYPPGPGLAVARKTCLYCHGANFIPARHLDAKAWNAAIDYMTGKDNRQGAMIQPNEMSQSEREVLVQYLVQNFGPNSKTRAVKVETEMPVDETKLAKAMYVEYYFPPDPPGSGIHDPKYAGITDEGPFAGRRVSQDVHFDQQGNVWIIDRGFPNRLCKLDPRTGQFKEYLTPDPTAGVHDLTIDKNGIVWVPENEGVPAGQLKLDGFNPKTEKWEARYPFDPENVIPASTVKHAQSLTIDSKGNIYTVLILGSGLSRWDRETKKMTTYPMPSPNAFPYGIVVDKNDNIWIAEFHASKIAKFDPKTEKFTEYSPPTQPALIRRLNVDSKGNIWFGLFSAGKLDKLNPATGKIIEYKIPHQVSQPYDVAESGDKLWIADAGQGGALIQFDPQAETFTYFPTPQRSDMPKLKITREGAVWYPPRSSQKFPGAGVLYPYMTKITTLGAYF